MRRTIFLALLAALLFAAAARATPPLEIQRDCADDGTLQGDYSPSDLRKARDSLPTDADEYSDCRDVLSRAIAKASGSSTGGGWDPAGSDSSRNGQGGGDGGSSTPDPASTATATPEPDGTATPAPSPQDDAPLLAQAAAQGDKPVEVDGKPVSPGASRLAAQVGRNGVPATTVAVVALFVLALLAAALMPLIRRHRGDARSEA
jgi:hypothetical protein